MTSEEPPEGHVTDVRERLGATRGLHMGHAIGVLVGLDVVVMVTLLAFMGPQLIPVVLLGVAGFPFLIFGLITQIMWQPHARRFPARPQSRDAVVKLYQSVAFGRLGRINNFVHIAADADHLHLIAPGIMRLTGARIISIPWDRFSEVKQKGLFGITSGKLDGRYFAAPTWCMRVALAQSAQCAEDHPPEQT
jgi:hypothetical protein